MEKVTIELSIETAQELWYALCDCEWDTTEGGREFATDIQLWLKAHSEIQKELKNVGVAGESWKK